MKFHWGHGLTLFFTLFIITLITVIVKSKSVDHTLVDDNYYQKDLGYQKIYDSIKNAKESNFLTINADRKSNAINLEFSDQSKFKEGKIYVYRPSDKFMDDTLNIVLDTELKTEYTFPTGGKWNTEFIWQDSMNKEYHINRDFTF